MATPTVPSPATGVQQWMCEAVVLLTRSSKSATTVMVIKSVSNVTCTVPVPGEATGGDERHREECGCAHGLLPL